MSPSNNISPPWPRPASAELLEQVAGCPGLPHLHVLSDVHLETGAYALPAELEFDILIAAGDIGPVEVAVPWLASIGKPVVYVLGNHEHWETEFGDAVKLARALAKGTSVHVLERDSVVLQGVRFLGATLWPDFGDWNRDLVGQALKYSRDYLQIKATRWWTRKSNQRLAAARAKAAGYTRFHENAFSPVIAYEEHLKTLEWLRQALRDRTDRELPTVVVSHHAPTRRSLLAAGVDETYLDPRHWGSRESSAGKVASYASPVLENKLDFERFGIALWVHGHLHHAIDIVEGGVRVVANPRGYARRPLTESDISASRLFGMALTAEDVARSQAAHAGNPYAGNGEGFDPLRVVRFGQGLQAPLTAALAGPLAALDALIAENEELLPLVCKGHDLATRCVERVFQENCERFTGLLQQVQEREGRAVDPHRRGRDIARLQTPNQQPGRVYPRFGGRLTRKAYVEELALMRKWRQWVAALPYAAELGLRRWVRLGVKGLRCLKAAGIEATLAPMGFENLRRLTYRDFEFCVPDESQHARASELLEQLYNRGRIPREVLFTVRRDTLRAEFKEDHRALAELNAFERRLKG